MKEEFNLQKEYKRNCELRSGMVYPEGMQRLCLVVEYNGSNFHGFQAQSADVKTVQHELEAALSSIADESITVVCAGRTDAGVHASYQVVHFDTFAVRPLKAWSMGANARMSEGVSIQSAINVEPTFHSRFSAHSRTYRYIIYNNNARSAVLSKIATWQKRPLNVDVMKQAASYLVGKHDFSSFRASRCQAKTPVRTIQRIRIAQTKNLIVLEVKANAFLHHMIRNIMGTLFAIGFGEKPVQWMSEILTGMDRRKAAATAPSDGLYLVDVNYPEEFGMLPHTLGPVFLPDDLHWIDVSQ